MLNSLDRFIRIIYKEYPLDSLLTIRPKSQVSFSKILNQKIAQTFNLESKEFQAEIKNSYLSIYPNNYNEDEVQEMILWTKELLETYPSANTIYLFSVIVIFYMLTFFQRIKPKTIFIKLIFLTIITVQIKLWRREWSKLTCI